jgi:hypothetical protein
MTAETDDIIARLNEQRGELIGMNAMMVSIARSLPHAQLARLLAEFDTEIAFARSHVNNSPIPDEVISGLENYVKTWNMIRTEPNQD